MLVILDISLKLISDILKKKEKTKNLPFCPENKVIPKDNNNMYMKKIKSKEYTNTKKLLCGWTDEKN